MKLSEQFSEFGKDLLAGGFSGVVAKTLVFLTFHVMVRYDKCRVKLLLQTQHFNSKLLPHEYYKGPIDCVTRIYETEGFVSFWRGNLVNVTRFFPAQALNFALKDQYKTLVDQSHNNTYRKFLENLIVGGAAGVTSLSVVYPLDLARTRMAIDVKSSELQQYTGFRDCLIKSYQEGGIKQLYRGYGVAVAGVFLFRSFYLGGYDSLKSYFEMEKSNVFIRYAAAQALVTVVGTICYPIDTVKRRMMIMKSNTVQFLNGREVVKVILRKEGLRGFYAGLSVNIVRGISGALLLVLYDESKAFTRSGHGS